MCVELHHRVKRISKCWNLFFRSPYKTSTDLRFAGCEFNIFRKLFTNECYDVGTICLKNIQYQKIVGCWSRDPVTRFGEHEIKGFKQKTNPTAGLILRRKLFFFFCFLFLQVPTSAGAGPTTYHRCYHRFKEKFDRTMAMIRLKGFSLSAENDSRPCWNSTSTGPFPGYGADDK